MQKGTRMLTSGIILWLVFTFVQVAAQDLQEARSLIGRAKQLYEQERYEEALKSLGRALENDSSSALAWYERGKALDRLDRNEEALYSYDQALKLRPDYIEAWCGRGGVLIDLNKIIEALKSFGQALKLNPNFEHAQHGRKFIVDYLLRGFRYVYPEDWYGQGEIFSQEDEIISGSAKDKYLDYERAIGCYDQAIKYEPNYTDAWYNRGIILGKLERNREALQSFNKVLSIKPFLVDAWYMRGITLINMKRYSEALKSLNRALEIDPNYIQARQDRSALLKKLRQAPNK